MSYIKINPKGTVIKIPVAEYEILNLSVLANSSQAATTFTGAYTSNVGDSIEFTGTLQDGSSINYGTEILKLPVIRYAGDKRTDDEIYFNATIQNGVLSASGSFPRGGKWVFKTERINESIDSAGNGWYLKSEDITFLI